MFKTLQELNVCARSHELFMDWNPTCPGQADSAAVFPPTSTHPAALNMRSNTVTYCSSASRWWLWLVLLWICCGEALCRPGCCCCFGWFVRLWLEGMAQRWGLGSQESPPRPTAMVVLPLAKWRDMASCSQPCWQQDEASVCGPVSCGLPVVTPGGQKMSFTILVNKSFSLKSVKGLYKHFSLGTLGPEHFYEMGNFGYIEGEFWEITDKTYTSCFYHNTP